MRQAPLAGRYPAVAAMVVFALIPYLVLSAALQPISPIIADQLGMSAQAMNLTSGMANAGYALGTVLSVQFAQHLQQRRLLIAYAALLVVGSLLAAAAPSAGLYIAGHILQGLCTSLLLIAAVPPLIIGYPASKLRSTAVIMNLSIFGRGGPGPRDRRDPGRCPRLATAVLGHRGHRGRGAGTVCADVRGLTAG
jgi:predicted MFS family arabinose efflux permease